jgi:hypothetical protein
MSVQNIFAIQTRSLGAFPGDLTRPTAPFITEGASILSTSTALHFGDAVVLDSTSGKVRALLTGDTASSAVFGIVVRTFPVQSATYPNPLIGTAVAVDLNNLITIAKEGYIAVNVVAPVSPVKGGAVYVQYEADTVSGTAIAIGNFTTASDASKNFQLSGAHFTGGVDAQGNSEIYFRLPA